ncbi:MAG: glycosyltransferase family 4 protein [Polaribacter sp.]
MKDKLIYIYPKKTSFINNDIYFLEEKYITNSQDLDWGNAIKLPYNFIKQFIFLLINIREAKSIFVNFGGYFSLLPTLFGKLFRVKTFIILNGTDCVSFPRYNYGSLRKPFLKFFIKKSYEMATKLLPVDKSLIYQNYNFDENVIHKEQGIKAFFPNLKTPLKPIPNGFDTSFWNPSLIKKRKGFITVAIVNKMNTFRIKGIDLILKAAIHFPKENFTIVGISKEIKENLINIPENVNIISYLEKNRLKKEYQKNCYYIQVSVNEGFGCALSEAMLCGCIPIVSNVGALPNLTKNIGFKMYKNSSDELITVLKEAILLNSKDKIVLSKKANERIRSNFDISIREKLILEEIEN